MTPSTPQWTLERENDLRLRYGRGDRVAAIAEGLDVTVNTIVGKVARMKLSRERADTWSAAEIEIIRLKWMAGVSAGVIAAQLGGTTRNAVMSVVHRHGIVRPLAPKKATASLTPTRTYRQPKKQTLQPTLAVIGPLPDMGRSPHAKPFMLTTTRECRWALGPASEPAHAMMLVCGAVTEEGRPYCGRHCTMSGGYQPRRIRVPYEATVVRRAS